MAANELRGPVLFRGYLNASERRQLLRTASMRMSVRGTAVISSNIVHRVDIEKITDKVRSTFTDYGLYNPRRDVFAGGGFDAVTLRYPVGAGNTLHVDDGRYEGDGSNGPFYSQWRMVLLVQASLAGGRLYIRRWSRPLKEGDAVLFHASHWPHVVTPVERGERVTTSYGRVVGPA